MIHAEGRPKIAIIDSNTLAAMGLKQMLQNVMPIMSVDTYGSFVELEASPISISTISSRLPSYWKTRVSSTSGSGRPSC